MKSLLSRFSGDESGVTVLIFALALIPLLGFLGMSIDFGDSYRIRSRMQAATDAAALAAASLDNATDSERVTQANNTFAANFSNPGTKSAVTPNVSLGGGNITVTASGDVETNIMSVLEISEVTLGVTSVAIIKKPFEPCLIALDSTSSNAVYVQDDAEIRTKKCGVAVNSSANDAVVMDGDSEWDAQVVNIVGNYVQSGGEIDASDGVYANVSSEADPYLPVDIPSFGGCSGGTNLVITSDTTLNPGTYCGGLTIENGADVTLNPGQYIIDGGDLFMEEISEIKGDGVVIFLTSSGGPSTIGSLRVTDHSRIHITSPTAGIYADIAIYQDRNAPASGKNEISGVSSGSGPGPEIDVEGSVYLPSQQLVMDGDALLRIRKTSPCGKMVAKSYELEDDARLRIDCDDGGSGSGPNIARLIQ